MGKLSPHQALTPEGQVLGHQTMQAGFNSWLQLFVCLLDWVVARKDAHCGYSESAELLPERGNKLLALVRHNTPRKSMHSKDMLHHDLSHFFGRGQLGQSNEMHHF